MDVIITQQPILDEIQIVQGQSDNEVTIIQPQPVGTIIIVLQED